LLFYQDVAVSQCPPLPVSCSSLSIPQPWGQCFGTTIDLYNIKGHRVSKSAIYYREGFTSVSMPHQLKARKATTNDFDWLPQQANFICLVAEDDGNTPVDDFAILRLPSKYPPTTITGFTNTKKELLVEKLLCVFVAQL
jgi:hypothetical protein